MPPKRSKKPSSRAKSSKFRKSLTTTKQPRLKKEIGTQPAVTMSANEILYPRESGPRKWLLPILESAYTKLVPRDQAKSRRTSAKAALSKEMFHSQLQPGHGEDVLARMGQDLWLNRVREY